jgi:hypothetical protein
MFTQLEIKNIQAIVELAFRSGLIATSQDAAAALSLQAKAASLIEQDTLPAATVEFADED